MKEKDLIAQCYLCGGRDIAKRTGQVRDKPDIDILECRSYGLVFLSSFNHINNGFYESSGMDEVGIVNFNTGDVEEWLRKTKYDDDRRFHFCSPLIDNKSVLDFGCGNGGFLLKARKKANKIVGIEPAKSLKSHFLKNEIVVHSNIDALSETFDIFTIFHVLEHIPDPRELLVKLGERLKEGGQLIIEVPSSDDALLRLYKCKLFSYFTYWSCHLFLFSAKNLKFLGEESGFKVNYVKQIQRYPLSSHLYWLSEGGPGGHEKWSFIDSEELNNAYESQLASIGYCDTLIASFTKK